MKSQRAGFKTDVPYFGVGDVNIGTVEDIRQQGSVYLATGT
jgi:hypothetical protein